MGNRTRSFIGGMAMGYGLGSRMKDDYKTTKLEEGLGEAGSANSVTETVTGDDAKAAADKLETVRNEEFNRARDAALAQGGDGEAAGLAAAQQYDPSLQELRGRGDKPEFSVMNRGNVVGTHANAMGAQAAADSANTRGMGDVYKQFGRPEAAGRLQQQAQSLEAGALALKGARREDQVGEASQSLKLGAVENQLGLLKQDFKNRAAAGTLKGIDLQKELVGSFADAAEKNPAFANTLLKDPDFLGALGIKDAEYAPEGRDSIVFTMADGTKQKAVIADLQEWRHGKQPLKTVTLSEGASLYTQGKDGTVREVARNEKKPDPSKNNAAMDDAVATMTRLLDTNKNMMTQFGGNEQKAREEMRLNHDKGIGEFQRRAGRPPSIEESAVIAEGVFKRAQAKYLGGK